MVLNLAFTVGFRIILLLGVEVNLEFKVIQEDLLLLTNGDTCCSFDGLDLIDPNMQSVLLDLKLCELFGEMVLCKLGVVFLFVKPRIVVPDRSKSRSLFSLHFAFFLIKVKIKYKFQKVL